MVNEVHNLKLFLRKRIACCIQDTHTPSTHHGQACAQVKHLELRRRHPETAGEKFWIKKASQNIIFHPKHPNFCWKTTKLCENHQKQIRNALQPNCITINAIIVTNTTKYGSVHRSGTLHHKPSSKNTERSQKTTKGHKRPPRIQMPPRDD